jgi:sterol desaturase/sphingolipid hydroxylase (fatty acid hydroxylase superfamily)
MRARHLDFDFSTNFRRHPLEVLATAAMLVPAILIVGAPPRAVFWLVVLRAAVRVFEHANLRLPLGLDRVLRASLRELGRAVR